MESLQQLLQKVSDIQLEDLSLANQFYRYVLVAWLHLAEFLAPAVTGCLAVYLVAKKLTGRQKAENMEEETLSRKLFDSERSLYNVLSHLDKARDDAERLQLSFKMFFEEQDQVGQRCQKALAKILRDLETFQTSVASSFSVIDDHKMGKIVTSLQEMAVSEVKDEDVEQSNKTCIENIEGRLDRVWLKTKEFTDCFQFLLHFNLEVQRKLDDTKSQVRRLEASTSEERSLKIEMEILEDKLQAIFQTFDTKLDSIRNQILSTTPPPEEESNDHPAPTCCETMLSKEEANPEEETLPSDVSIVTSDLGSSVVGESSVASPSEDDAPKEEAGQEILVESAHERTDSSTNLRSSGSSTEQHRAESAATTEDTLVIKSTLVFPSFSPKYDLRLAADAQLPGSARGFASIPIRREDFAFKTKEDLIMPFQLPEFPTYTQPPLFGLNYHYKGPDNTNGGLKAPVFSVSKLEELD